MLVSLVMLTSFITRHITEIAPTLLFMSYYACLVGNVDFVHYSAHYRNSSDIAVHELLCLFVW